MGKITERGLFYHAVSMYGKVRENRKLEMESRGVEPSSERNKSNFDRQMILRQNSGRDHAPGVSL